MREVLELCIELDTQANRVYKELAQSCSDPDLASLFEVMAHEESQHLEWWNDLLDAWESGLVPDIALDADLRDRLQQIADDLADPIQTDCSVLGVNQMLELAVHLEFYMLDPVFAELLELAQPGSRVRVREAYSHHVVRLVEAIETHYTESSLARFLAQVLRRAFRDQQRLAALAMHDQLTGLFNRRGMLGYLNQWLAWSMRYGHPVSAVLIDIDGFKAINDTYGHAKGDEALIAVTQCLVDAVRSADIVSRFGGDEFLVLAPETDERELSQLMERIGRLVRDVCVDADGVCVPLSVSCGGAWAPGGSEVAPEALIGHADRSLYQAKEAGRDRAGDPMLAGPGM